MNNISRTKILEALDFEKNVELKLFKNCLLNEDVYTDVLVIYKKSKFSLINKFRALNEVNIIREIYGFKSLRVNSFKDSEIVNDYNHPLFYLFLYLFGNYGELNLVDSNISEYNKTILPKDKCIKSKNYNLHYFAMDKEFIYNYINTYTMKDLLKDKWLLVWFFNMSDLVSKHGCYDYRNFKELEYIKEKRNYGKN